MSEIKITTVTTDNVLAAYRNASGEQRELLEQLFGRDIFQPNDITQRIKTFADCVEALGENNPLVKACCNVGKGDVTLKAFCMLRVIVAALNEGWQPTYAEGERRWYPWFKVLTNKEYNSLSKEQQSRVVCRVYHNSYAHGGFAFAFAFANFSSANAVTIYGSRLAFKSEQLAEYAATQFGEVWADFLLG